MERPDLIVSQKPTRVAVRASEGGFTLTEVALAMAIFSFAIVSMLGMLTVGVRNSRKANVQISASNLLSTLVADIQAAKRTESDTGNIEFECRKIPLKPMVTFGTGAEFAVQARYTDPLVLDEAGSLSNNPLNNGLLKVFRVKFTPASSSIPALRIRVSWPANTPDTALPEGYLETIVALPLP